jgi:erythromycin esterase-like protein
MYGTVQVEELDPEEVQEERAERYRLFEKNRSRDGGTNAFDATFAEITKEARNGEQGLAHMKRKLMVEHPALWVNRNSSCYSPLPIAGCMIVLQVIEERMDEMQDALDVDGS